MAVLTGHTNGYVKVRTNRQWSLSDPAPDDHRSLTEVVDSMKAITIFKTKEVDALLDWATKEGWNPGIDDSSVFFSADQNGFIEAYE